MALFSKKKESGAAPKTTTGTIRDIGSAIIRPHITEKAAIQTGNDVYVFEVTSKATKMEIAKAIVALYKVVPVKVNIVTKSPRRVASRTRRGIMGTKTGMKKAYVYLKKGDKIEFV